MFFGVLFLAIGVAVLLNALGIFSYSAWGIFWGIFFIAIGIRMMIRRGKCPMCGWGMWQDRMHEKIHQKMHGHCDCDCDHEHGEEDHH